MQTGKTFKTEIEAKNFVKFHRKYWIHKVYEGIKRSTINPYTLIGYHVVYFTEQ